MKESKASDYRYEDISIGHEFGFDKKITANDVNLFAELTGDRNPLHCDDVFAKGTKFGSRVVHGMLVGSLFSTLFGMVCPGKRNLYLSQSLNFKKPVYVGSEVRVEGKVVQKIDGPKLLVVETKIICKGEVMIIGEAKVMVMDV